VREKDRAGQKKAFVSEFELYSVGNTDILNKVEERDFVFCLRKVYEPRSLDINGEYKIKEI